MSNFFAGNFQRMDERRRGCCKLYMKNLMAFLWLFGVLKFFLQHQMSEGGPIIKVGDLVWYTDRMSAE